MMLLDRRHLLMRTTALLGAASWPHTVAAAPPELRRTTDIDAVLQAGVEAGDLPGVVAMAATERTVLYQGCFGFREINRRTAMTPDTIFRIASMVKLLTSVAAMQLVEQGRLGLDEPAARLLPTLASPQVLTGFDAKGDPQLRPARSPITLRHLLTHTSGFSYSLWDENALHYQQRARRSKSLPRRPLAFDPGTKWAYGTSIDRVSNLVEAASGKTIDRYFRDHILDPLGMSDTGFALTDKRREREANLHVRKDGALSPVPLEKKGPPPESFSGGGGIYSSAFDYMRLLQALLGRGSFNGATILRPETVALMGQNQIGDIEAGIMTTTSSRISANVNFMPGVRLRWNLANMTNLDPVEGGRKAGSWTWAGLYNTHYWLDPESGMAAVFMTQLLPFADERTLRVYRNYELAVYRALAAL